MHKPASTSACCSALEVNHSAPLGVPGVPGLSPMQEPVLISLKHHTPQPQIICIRNCTTSSSAMTVFIQSVTSNNCCCRCQNDYRMRTPKELPFWCHYLLKSISLIWDSAVMINFPMVAQSPYYIHIYS